jgi:hypothetical protein
MKKLVKGVLLLAAVVSTGFSQTILITGHVTNPENKPIQAVIVRLSNSDVLTRTDPNGNYTLTNGIVNTIQPNITIKGNAVPAPVFSRGRVLFSLPESNTHVVMNLYDMSGRFVKEILNSTLGKGNYSIALDKSKLSSQCYILRSAIGGSVRVTAIPSVFSNFGGVVGQTSAAAEPRLQKAAAVVDTIVAAKVGYSSMRRNIETTTGTQDFVLQTNTPAWNGDTMAFWGDTGAIPKATKVMTYVFVNRTNGKYTDSQIFWTAGGVTHTLAESKTYDMGNESSGRVNFHLGTANGPLSDFIEHTIGANVWNGNTTRVDAWGFPIAIWLHCKDGYNARLGEEYHVFYSGRDTLFKAFKDAVPKEFTHCATNGYPNRIIAPGKGDGGFQNSKEFANYMIPYLTQLGRPGTTNDVFACENEYGQKAGVAGAINRHVADLDTSKWRDTSLYYKAAPANYYALFWHENSFERKCYGFAYDDAAGQAAYTSHGGPMWLITAIGF